MSSTLGLHLMCCGFRWTPLSYFVNKGSYCWHVTPAHQSESEAAELTRRQRKRCNSQRTKAAGSTSLNNTSTVFPPSGNRKREWNNSWRFSTIAERLKSKKKILQGAWSRLFILVDPVQKEWLLLSHTHTMLCFNANSDTIWVKRHFGALFLYV